MSESESIVSLERDCVFGGRGKEREYSATPGWPNHRENQVLEAASRALGGNSIG